MLRAVLFTFLGFAFAILLGLFGTWAAGRIGAWVGICGGLGISFLGAAYVLGR